MKSTIIGGILIAFILISTLGYAEQWPDADEIVAQVQTELDLNPDQFAKVKTIIEENMTKRKELNQGKDLMLSQSQPLDSQLYRKLSDVMTQEQMGQWTKMLSRMMREMYVQNDVK